MKSFLLAACVALFGVSGLGAAEPPQPPAKSAKAKKAEVAVRGQAQKFYDLLVAAKPRAAEALVCEASKEAYYSMNKPAPRSAEVRNVTFSDGMKSAKLMVLVEGEYSLGFETKVVKMPTPSDWKLESGHWCYYIPPATEELETPFGKMKLGKPDVKPGEAPAAPAPIAVDPEKLTRKVTFSKEQISLSPDVDGKDEIIIANGLNGPIQFRLACPDVPGLQCKLEQSYIAAGKEGKLVVEFTFKGTKIGEAERIHLWVLPFESLKTFPFRRPAEAPKP